MNFRHLLSCDTIEEDIELKAAICGKVAEVADQRTITIIQ